ncbi:cyclic nucleotide-binding domain-containing protein [Bradyrhizobium sp. AUGA SZCCT0177]|uniref:cyclic nucleotide-binding domain-containing protein n=1 Tax=Bradyrhizobium sp. AUGA SZCCT0177 TaxID=2807665 RepID=UPI0032DEAA9A
MIAQGDAADTVSYIQSGRVKVVVISEQGKASVVGILGPGQFSGGWQEPADSPPHFALSLRSRRNLCAVVDDILKGRKPDEAQIRTSRAGHFSWRCAFDRNRFGYSARPLGTAPAFECRTCCSGLRSTRLRSHGARVSARSLRRPPPVCTSRLWISSGLSSLLT